MSSYSPRFLDIFSKKNYPNPSRIDHVTTSYVSKSRSLDDITPGKKKKFLKVTFLSLMVEVLMVICKSLDSLSFYHEEKNLLSLIVEVLIPVTVCFCKLKKKALFSSLIEVLTLIVESL